jgi:hypothetical protein
MLWKNCCWKYHTDIAVETDLGSEFRYREPKLDRGRWCWPSHNRANGRYRWPRFVWRAGAAAGAVHLQCARQLARPLKATQSSSPMPDRKLAWLRPRHFTAQLMAFRTARHPYRPRARGYYAGRGRRNDAAIFKRFRIVNPL